MENELNLKYTEKDGILYPDLEGNVPKPLGRFGRMRWKYLVENKRSLAMRWHMEGTLRRRMEKVDEEANAMLDRLQQQMLEKDPVPRTDDILERTRHLNSIRDAAEEIVLKTLIYSN